ncbi:MAG: capsule assembly Wzi family protein [Bacteroidota bacterium]
MASLMLFLLPSLLFSQQENVPATHPVYAFLKRMEVKGVIVRYHDAVLPLARREVAQFLSEIARERERLTDSEQGRLSDFLSEFRYDISGTATGFSRLIDPPEQESGGLGEIFSNREKFLYYHSDSTLSFFVNGLIDVDARRIGGDALGNRHAEYLQAGGRLRGTVLGHLGYYAQWTNAQFWGSRELLARDPIISQSSALGVGNIQNFDVAESYLRYGTDVVSAQVGRERILWGNGYDQQMTVSDNARPFDFVRFDAQYKALKYTFLHGWLVGTAGRLAFMVPADTSHSFVEEVAADKYLVAHRLELSFPGVLDLGLQEMLIYGNRAPDLAYLNPLTIVESSQRSRGERDNAYWALDVQAHFIPGFELNASIVYDDINVPDLFTSVWSDRYAWQAGMFYADMFGIGNTNLIVEYTRVEPYVYSHARSREGSYTNLDRLLGPRIGPNADSWFFRSDYLPLRNLTFSLRVTFVRKGENVTDVSGYVIKNVGSDPFLPHRETDPRTKKFLDGTLFKSRSIEFRAQWEIVNQIWLEGVALFDSMENALTGARNENRLVTLHLRTEF